LDMFGWGENPLQWLRKLDDFLMVGKSIHHPTNSPPPPRINPSKKKIHQYINSQTRYKKRNLITSNFLFSIFCSSKSEFQNFSPLENKRSHSTNAFFFSYFFAFRFSATLINKKDINLTFCFQCMFSTITPQSSSNMGITVSSIVFHWIWMSL
jgi:hypothetical protein